MSLGDASSRFSGSEQADSKALDVKGYRSLSEVPLLKERFDNWLEREKINISNCMLMEYQPGRLRCTLYETDDKGQRYMGEDGEPATKVVIYYPTSAPPLGVFERVSS